MRAVARRTAFGQRRRLDGTSRTPPCSRCTALLFAPTAPSSFFPPHREARHSLLSLAFSTSQPSRSASLATSTPLRTRPPLDSTTSDPINSRGSSRSSSSADEERADSSEDTSPASAFWSSLFAPFRRAFAWYLGQLNRRPYTVQMLTSAFLFAIGDITAQHYEAYIDQHKAAASTPSHPHPHPHELLHHHELHPDAPPSTPFSYHRLLACTLFGLLVMGPGGHWWYTRLDQWVAPWARPLTMRNVGLKVLLDTAIFNPVFLVVFFSSVSLMEGKGWGEIRRKLWRDFVPSYAVDCSVWPLVQTFNFRLVPVPLQLLVVNLFCQPTPRTPAASSARVLTGPSSLAPCRSPASAVLWCAQATSTTCS